MPLGERPLTEDSTYYTISYIDKYFPDEIRTTIISTPHEVSRTKEILAEVHPEWYIISVVLNTSYKIRDKETLGI